MNKEWQTERRNEFIKHLDVLKSCTFRMGNENQSISFNAFKRGLERIAKLRAYVISGYLYGADIDRFVKFKDRFFNSPKAFIYLEYLGVGDLSTPQCPLCGKEGV